jgi:putative ABC transport system permease protein
VGKMLVVAQVALSLVLVAGAALLLGSWRRLATVDPGFKSEGVVMLSAVLPVTGASEQRGILFRQILERLRATPGVQSAASAELTPMGSSSWNNFIDVPGYSAKSEHDAVVWMNEVTEGYFATLGTPFIDGRDFDARDVPSSPKVAIVSEALARRFFGAASPLGRTFRIQEGKSHSAPVTIVGVVKDTKYRSMRDDREPIAYFARAQNADVGRYTTFAVRARGDVASIVPRLRAVLQEMTPRARLDIAMFETQIAESLQLPRTLATLSGFFGSLALLLAMIGLYGIMAYSVARRRNEIGVRIALGAARGRVVRMVLGETGRMVVAGVAAGTLLALAGAKFVASFLYGIEPSDPATLAASAILLVGVGLLAAALPAARAARLDPVTALRED